ncbi:hypothetical protein E0Z10_g6879 [Xylaria hypoxylon]|uniref:Uncharacterized protein n=1 Tax=Xylaria hypoxylon TaxID=37992 RepID=A0A4Z0YR66_9PEZI|nr:hypothetical protein E0Z10_g6879 [Xylaria hypoxylon]
MSGLRTSVFQTARILPSHTSRLLHQTAVRGLPYKDDMDRESLKPKAHENTQSGTDEETATQHGDASFNPNKTLPETEKKAAGEGAEQQGKQNPLESSPADHDFAKGGSSDAQDRPQYGKSKKSGRGNAPKAGKVN